MTLMDAFLLGMLAGGNGSGGGAGVFVVNVEAVDGTITADKTFTEIHAAAAAKKTVLLIDETMYYGLLDTVVDNEIVFVNMDCNVSGTLCVTAWYCFSSDDWEKQTRKYQPSEEETVTGSTPSFAAAKHKIYKCGEVTSLTLSSVPLLGEYMVIFYSGSTAAVLSLPNDLDDHMPSGFSVEANKRYEINVYDNWPVIQAFDWEATPSA